MSFAYLIIAIVFFGAPCCNFVFHFDAPNEALFFLLCVGLIFAFMALYIKLDEIHKMLKKDEKKD